MLSLLEAKSLAAGLLFGGSLIAGLLPKWMGVAERIEHSLVLSIILCFGAGVLLSTSLIHILRDTVTALPVWGEMFFCAGFMALYFIDELVQFWCLVAVKPHKHNEQHYSEANEEENLISSGTSSSGYSKYGSIKKVIVPSDGKLSRLPEPEDGLSKRKIEKDPEIIVEEEHLKTHDTTEDAYVKAPDQHVNSTLKSSSKDAVKKVGLIIAFSTHSILEGLAVGTQPNTSKVIVLLLAVSCHKLVITFCLGAELISDGTSFGMLIGSLSFYALSSGIGVVIGTVLNSTNNSAIPVLQGLAGGSLLYITLGEILPRERFHKNHCLMPKVTGLIQFISVLCGIIPITVMSIFVDSQNS